MDAAEGEAGEEKVVSSFQIFACSTRIVLKKDKIPLS